MSKLNPESRQLRLEVLANALSHVRDDIYRGKRAGLLPGVSVWLDEKIKREQQLLELIEHERS